jgi:hypothetical protein
METMDVRLQQAIAAARAGKREESRVLVDRFLEDQPENVHAIFLKSTLAASKEEQVENLRQVLEIDPDHRGAKLMLDRLGVPLEVEPPTIVQPFPEPEEQPIEEEVEPIVVAEDDFPAEEIVATVVGITASEMEPEVVDEIDIPFGEELAKPELEETLIVYPDEPVIEEFEEIPEIVAEEEIPDWLTEDADIGAEATIVQDEFIDEEEMPLEMGELPDWLQEEPTEEWLSQEQTKPVVSEDEFLEDFVEEPVFIAEEETLEEPVHVLTPPKTKKKGKQVSKRTLEIVLGLLIILAFLVMAGLVYVFLSTIA